jgi:hypothetical protein
LIILLLWLQLTLIQTCIGVIMIYHGITSKEHPSENLCIRFQSSVAKLNRSINGILPRSILSKPCHHDIPWSQIALLHNIVIFYWSWEFVISW